MKHRLIVTRLIALSILINSGCASVLCRSGLERKPTPIYPATVLDVSEIVLPSGPRCGDGGYRPPPLRLRPDALLGTALLIFDLPISIVVDTLCLPFDIYGEHKKTLAEPKRKIGETTFLIVHPSGNGGTAQLLWTVSNRSDRVYLDLLANVGEKKTPPGKRYSDLEVDVSFDKTGRCWTVVYRANNGTDAFVCSDTLLYAAPEEGYQKVLVVNGPPWPKYLYLRSRSPAIYSRLLLEHDAWQEPDSSGRFRILYKAWTNPYGERNLEYDNSVESFWCVKKALDEDAKKAIEAKRLPLKPDLPKLIKEDKERRVREDKERRIQEDKERRIQEQADRGKEK